jgi:flagellar biosynthesis GTPase FlhF
MKLVGIIGTAVLSLTLGVAAPAYAQDKQEEEKSKPTQEEKKAEPAKPKKQDEKNAQQQDKNTKQEEKSTQQQDKNNQQEQKNAQQQDRNNKQEEKNAQQQQHNQPAQRAGGGSRIPDDRYRANFGREHSFHVSHADYDRDRRFQYGGYWFSFVDVWPSNWQYTQDVFVVEIDGMYYLCNPMYPGINVALNVTL